MASGIMGLRSYIEQQVLEYIGKDFMFYDRNSICDLFGIKLNVFLFPSCVAVRGLSTSNDWSA